MRTYVYVEGGGSGPDSSELDISCRRAFGLLLESSGFRGRKPRIVPCGGRRAVYDRFVTEHSRKAGTYVAIWIDSEEPMADVYAAWDHLQNVKTVPKWKRPKGATDDQVLFMTTCMETWIVSDRSTLKEHYGNKLQETALPPIVDLEQRDRHEVQKKLILATRNCSNPYAKGKHSYEILGKLRPAALEKLPSFVRIIAILNDKLQDGLE